jgi:hypothetical protein
MNGLGDFEEEEVCPKKYFIIIKNSSICLFFLLENLFLVKDLWKIEREMLHIYTNEIEKIHFVQPKKNRIRIS